jgi:hypothetical protein
VGEGRAEEVADVEVELEVDGGREGNGVEFEKEEFVKKLARCSAVD